MNSASTVGDIFIAAGEAFKTLADLTLQLHPSASQTDGIGAKPQQQSGAGRRRCPTKGEDSPSSPVAVAQAPTTADAEHTATSGPGDVAQQRGGYGDLTLAALNGGSVKQLPATNAEGEGTSALQEFDSVNNELNL